MRVTGGKLANADRRLLASMDRDERWQQVKVPIASALWDVWGRYCEVAGISMGRGIAALIDIEVEALADGREDVTERARLLDLREVELDARERDLERRELELDRLRTRARTPSRVELARMANEIEPPDPGWSSPPRTRTSAVSFSGVERNELCPCGSGIKFKRCHGSPAGPPSP